MQQLLAHLIGDYILQSHDMATKKVNSTFWALCHAFTYTIPFIFLTENWKSLFLIFITHFLIDRFRLAKYVIMLKNIVFGSKHNNEELKIFLTDTGYPKETPAWLSVWLMIITDNTLHLLINYLILK